MLTAPGRSRVVMRSWMTFWNRAASNRQAPPFTVAPTSTWSLDSGLMPALPKMRPPPSVVKFAAISVAVGARKPEDAPARRVSQSVAFQARPVE